MPDEFRIREARKDVANAAALLRRRKEKLTWWSGEAERNALLPEHVKFCRKQVKKARIEIAQAEQKLRHYEFELLRLLHPKSSIRLDSVTESYIVNTKEQDNDEG